MRISAVILFFLLIAGGLAWWFHDSLPFPRGEESAEISLEAAEIAEGKLERMREDGEPVRLSSVELSSLLRFRSPSWTLDAVRDPQVEMAGDSVRVSGIVPTDRLPSHPDLDRVRGLLPDSATLEVAGHVRSFGDGRAALDVKEVEFAGIPIPERYYPPMLERLGRRGEPGLGPTEMALPLPVGVSEVRVENGFLVLIP